MITDWIKEQSRTVSEFIFTYKQGISNKNSRHKMEVALDEIMHDGTYPYEQLYTVVEETVKKPELKDKLNNIIEDLVWRQELIDEYDE